MVARAGQAGLRLTPRQVFAQPTLAALARLAEDGPALLAEQGPVTGPSPLTPIQRWFLEAGPRDPQHFNQSLLLTVPADLDENHLRAALGALLAHHDALRSRFVRGADGVWAQELAAPNGVAPLEVVGLPPSPVLGGGGQEGEGRRVANLEAHAAALQASLNLAHGPLLRAALYRGEPDAPGRLLLVAHHLVIDGVSWRVLLEDLATALAQQQAGAAIRLPAKTSAARTWAERLAAHAHSPALRRELPAWQAIVQSEAGALPLDQPRAPDDLAIAASEVVVTALDAETTRAVLLAAPRAYNLSLDELLLAALALALRDWSGHSRQRIDREHHGREGLFPELDLSRTVGWFTSIAPVLLDLEGRETPDAVLMSVKEQLRQAPHGGIGYGLLRYLGPDDAREALAARGAEVLFNYLGQLGAAADTENILGLADEPTGPAVSPRQSLSHPLIVNSVVAAGQIELSITFSRNLHHRASIELLAERLIGHVRALAAHCIRPESGAFTPSDFPLIPLTQPQIDALSDLVGRQSGRPPRELIEAIYPLAPLQQGLLFHSLYAPEEGLYCEQKVLAIGGDLDLVAFERAWQYALERHPILRTAFVWQELPQPAQVVWRAAPLRIERLDWRDAAEEEQAARLEALMQTERRRGFALDRAPLLRLTLAQLSDGSYQLLWTYHHLLLDGRSLPVLLGEVFSAYDALCAGRAPQLEPSRPYGDYIAWLQRQDMGRCRGLLASDHRRLRHSDHAEPPRPPRPRHSRRRD